MLICAVHGRKLVCAQNSVYAEQLTNDVPYQIWSTDRWECPYPFCPTSILLTAPQAVVQYYDEGRYHSAQERVEVRFH